MMLIKLVTLAAVVTTAAATLGFDGNNAYSVSTFECMKRQGYSFFIGRVQHSYGGVDSTGIQNLKNAKAGGIEYVDGYLFPCVTCGDGGGQVEKTVNAVRSAGAPMGTLWLDIERYKWSSSLSSNQAFIRSMVSKAQSMGVRVGIYSSITNWGPIAGDSFDEFKSLPLWWPYYNNQQSLNDFSHFGGWTRPAIHQYNGDVKVSACGNIDIDSNYY